MHAKDIMTKDVHYIYPDTTVTEAAILMRERNWGCIPVGENEKLIGMLTDRDIVIRVIAEEKDPTTTKVRQAMTPQIIYGFEDDTTEICAQRMRENKIRRLPILNKDKRLVGIVTLGDLAMRSDTPVAHEVLKSISSPR